MIIAAATFIKGCKRGMQIILLSKGCLVRDIDGVHPRGGKRAFQFGENNIMPNRTVSWGKGIRRQKGYCTCENGITLDLLIINEKGIQWIREL